MNCSSRFGSKWIVELAILWHVWIFADAEFAYSNYCTFPLWNLNVLYSIFDIIISAYATAGRGMGFLVYGSSLISMDLCTWCTARQFYFGRGGAMRIFGMTSVSEGRHFSMSNFLGGGPETKACSTLSWWCHAKRWNIRSSRFDHLRDWGLSRASENVCISDIHSNWNFQDSPQVPLLEGIQLLYSHHERPSVGPIKEPS